MPRKYAFLQCSLNVLRRVVFSWIKTFIMMGKMTFYCSRGAHIGVHRLIFLGLLMIFPIVTFIFLPGGLVGTIGALERFLQLH